MSTIQNRLTTTRRTPEQERAPDLHTQFEDLLGAVWQAEANWRLDDRLDLAVRSQHRPRH